MRQALEQVAQMPLPRHLQSGTDFALHASQLDRRHGLTAFARYCFPARIGQGTKIPSLIEIVPLSTGQENRSGALAGLATFCSTLRWRAKEVSAPSSYRHAAEQVVAEVELLAGGHGSFAQLLHRLVAWRRQEQLRREHQQLKRFRYGRPELPAEWFALLQRELDGPEWRLALALASGQPHASTADILLLENRLDAAFLEDLQLGIGWIEASGLPPASPPEEQPAWLPPDFLAGVLLQQWEFHPERAVEGDRARWRELLLAGHAEEAMAMALQGLRSCGVVSWRWPVITHSNPQLLLRAVDIPLHATTLHALRCG